MKPIFEQGEFNAYASVRLDEARTKFDEVYHFAQAQTTVFISHKHDELNDLKGILGFLQQNYGVKVYIDSQDPSLPKKTSPETATQIKNRIERCNKFILLATNGAIDSKWCNWELGYGDAKKFKEHIALFPMKPEGAYDSSYKGNEYLAIYPYITYYYGTEKYKDGKPIQKGYYVLTEGQDTRTITPLESWLKRN